MLFWLVKKSSSRQLLCTLSCIHDVKAEAYNQPFFAPAKGAAIRDFAALVNDGVKVDYKTWVPFADLPSYMQLADVCLGGPFGDTIQSQFVITGKTYQLLQMGRPVIVGQNLESGIFTDKSNVLIVKQNNADSLAGAILWAQSHPVELKKIGQNGRKLYQNKLSNCQLSEQLRLMFTNKNLL